ncbi:Uncharacterised protein [Mycobacteroides abscessus]|nr:Uncharacterised protein [Mycobacteroides abscessus]
MSVILSPSPEPVASSSEPEPLEHAVRVRVMAARPATAAIALRGRRVVRVLLSTVTPLSVGRVVAALPSPMW